MKTYILVGLLVLCSPAFAHAAIYAKYDGVDGSSLVKSALSVQGSLTVERGTLTLGSSFTLDGSRSTDDGSIRKYSWKQVSGPSVRIADTHISSISVVPSAGVYVFEVVVTDANGRVVETRRFEITVTAPTTNAAATSIQAAPQEAGGDVFMEIDTIKGESSEPKKGNVEYEWKVEEGESAAVPGVEPDEIDYNGDSEPVMPDFAILLGGGTTEAGGAEAAQDVFVTEAMAADAAIESISLNYEKITTKIKQEVKLFGVIPVVVTVTVDVDAQARVKVKYPWLAVIATGKKSDELGTYVVNLLSNVLKTKHDTVKNSVGNIR